MELQKTIPANVFYSRFKRTGIKESAIFSERRDTMEEIYETGAPIYCDQSYYVLEQQLNLVEKIGDHFECDGHKNFESWRDCHYYYEYEDEDGCVVWLMVGGKY